MPASRTVVIPVSIAFPPASEPEAQRVLHWLRHLPDLGWRPIVLALPENHVPAARRDEALLGAIAPGTEVRRIRLPGGPGGPVRRGRTGAVVAQLDSMRRRGLNVLRRRVMIPDGLAHWAPPAFREIARIARERPVDAVLTTTPSTNHLVGMLAARRLGIPWVADFQGPWHWPLRAGAIRRAASIRLGHRVMDAATLVTATTEAIAELVLAFAGADPGRMRLVPDAVVLPDTLPPAIPDGRLTISFAGRLYPERDPTPFLRAIDDLVGRRPELAGVLDVRLAGKAEGGVAGSVRAFAGRPWLTLLGWGTLEEARRLARESDVILIIPGLFTRSAGGRTIRYPAYGKAVELLGLGRPILDLWSARDWGEDFLDAAGGVLFAPMDDPAAIQRVIEDLVDHGPPPVPEAQRREALGRFAPERVVARMAGMLDDAVRLGQASVPR